jgi:uracil-DNA glycosylase
LSTDQLKPLLIVLGSNPSESAPDPSIAFDPTTKSGKTIRSWFQGLDAEIIYRNAVKQVTPNNRPLNTKELVEASRDLALEEIIAEPDAWIAVGNSAAKALSFTKTKLPILKIPHPSGKCRKLNDPNAVNKLKQDLQRLISGIRNKWAIHGAGKLHDVLDD